MAQTFETQFIKQYDKLYDYYNLCYDDYSNELFDELHDNLLYQIEGYSDWLDSGEKITHQDVVEIGRLVNQIEEYYKAVTSAPKINWIFS